MTDPSDATRARLAALRSRRDPGIPAPARRSPAHPAAKARLAAAGLGLVAVSGLTAALATTDAGSPTVTTAESATQPVVVRVRYTDDTPVAGDTTPVSVVELAAQPTVRVAAADSAPAATTRASG